MTTDRDELRKRARAAVQHHFFIQRMEQQQATNAFGHLPWSQERLRAAIAQAEVDERAAP